MPMLKNGSLRVLVGSIVLFALIGGGCDSKQQCGDKCSKDSDCNSELSCFSTQADGQICLPSSCATCVGSTPTCSYEENSAGVCSFNACH